MNSTWSELATNTHKQHAGTSMAQSREQFQNSPFLYHFWTTLSKIANNCYSLHLFQYDGPSPSGPVLILAFRSLNFPLRKCCVKRLLLQFAAKGLAYQKRALTKWTSDIKY